ncbi:laminin-like protein epi-1 [Patiria miniata]|uniref:Laminin G domain-containing protein n=1 Tax=Patiria miniata TaxID=46514 RepID=A0A913ZX33_PATMI|nr:laminin-like protein epi-1 [Patiria miniata]
MSLWNFADAINAYDGISRSDTISVPVDPDTDGVLFDGSGYIALEKEAFNARFTSMNIAFKTHAANGLLFFIGDQGKYFTVELKGGRLQFDYDLGTGPLTLITDLQYNNGEQTMVQATLRGNAGSLRVTPSSNVVEAKSGESPGDGSELAAGEYFYVGGLAAIPDDLFPSVTRDGFRGCLTELSFGGQQINPLKNKMSFGIYPNCGTQRVGLVSFNGPFGGYVSRTPIDIKGDISIIFRFRTLEPDGVMVYASNADKTQFVAAMIVSGAVCIVADGKHDSIEVVSNQNSYNDGDWHTVIITKNNRKLTVVVDDSDSNFARFQKSALRTDGYFLVGGFPQPRFVEAAILPTTDNFIGCLSDLTVGFETVNFNDQILSDNNANVNVCPISLDHPTIPSSYTMGPHPGPVAPTIAPVPAKTMPGPVEGACKLPRVASAGEQLPEDEGADQYGITSYSRKEYPVLDDSFKRNMVMRVELKTLARNGLIMFTSDTRNIDFTAVYLRDGKVVFGWDYGSIPLLIESPESVNDGNWHTVRFA